MSATMIGWWIDDNPNKKDKSIDRQTFLDGVKQAIAYFQNKYHQIPNFLWVNKEFASIEISNMQIVPKREVYSKRFFYIGTK